MILRERRAGCTDTEDTEASAGASRGCCRVSVLMAVYNAASYITVAINSVLAQTLSEFELVVIDDGSTDGSGEIVARFAERDIRLVVHQQENRGIGAATNEGLRLARGEYVAILDSDDVMLPERLSVQARYLDEHREIAAVGSQWYMMSPAGGMVGLDRHATDPERLAVLMFGFFAMHHPTIMARREALIACGGYDSTIRRGCMDYGLFMKMLLAGYRIANLPNLLTRWRLAPGGATLGNALVQTEDCARIRAGGFQTLADVSPDRADKVAVSLVRAFPAGSWFDDKVRRLAPNAGPSPALARWHCLAADGLLPELEVLSVAWLDNEAVYGRDLAAALRGTGRGWLAGLVERKAGHEAIGVRRVGVGEQATDSGIRIGTACAGNACSLSVLVPVGRDSAVGERIDGLLAALPGSSEVIVFPVETDATISRADVKDARVRFLDVDQITRGSWTAALSAVRGRYVACLEPGHRHHPDFLKKAGKVLDAHKEVALMYAVSNIYYADALDAEGNRVLDPAPEPRWSREVLLGKGRFQLSCMVFRREALRDLPLGVADIEEVASWALARWLLVRNRPCLLDVRNEEVEPAVGLGNNIATTLAQRLVGWYLDTGLGSIPSEYGWAGLSAAEGQKHLRQLDAQFTLGNLCVHPGNLVTVLGFIMRYAPAPLLSATFREILGKYRSQAFSALRERGRLAAWLGLAWATADRIGQKVSRVPQAVVALLKP